MASLSSNSSDEKSSKRSNDGGTTTSNTNSIEYKSVCRFFHLLPERQFVQQGFEPNARAPASEKDIKVVKNKMTPKSKSSERHSSEPSQASSSSVTVGFLERSKSLNIKSPRAPRPHHSTKLAKANTLDEEYFEGIYIGSPQEG